MKYNEEMMVPLDEDELEGISGGLVDLDYGTCSCCGTKKVYNSSEKCAVCPNPNCPGKKDKLLVLLKL